MDGCLAMAHLAMAHQKRLPAPSRTAAGTGFKSQITPQNDISFNM
jgi:hypothetical protein